MTFSPVESELTCLSTPQLLSVAAEACSLHVAHPDKNGVFLPVTNNVKQEQV